MTKIFERVELIAILAQHLGIDPSKCEIVLYCPARGAHGQCHGVAIKAAK